MLVLEFFWSKNYQKIKKVIILLSFGMYILNGQSVDYVSNINFSKLSY